MGIFSILPITVDDDTLSVVPQADIDTLGGPEIGVFDHWIFDKGDSDGLIGVRNGEVLAPQTVTPAYSSNYLTLDGAVTKGLVSGLIDDGSNFTICTVVRQPVVSTNTRVLFGSYNGSKGAQAFFSGAVPARNLYVSVRGTALNVDTGKTMVKDEWRFVGMSCDVKSATKTIRALMGGQSAFSTTSAISETVGNVGFALGNAYYAAGGAGDLDYAEFILFPKALSEADLLAVYANSKVRMAARGLTVI